MKSDFELIVHKLPKTQSKVNIYPIGDSQVGSPNFDESLWHNWSEMVQTDPFAKIVIVGDMLNMGLKHSKSDSYNEQMRPRTAKEWLYQNLKPLKSHIIGAVRGNHEERASILTDECPLYDVLCKLDLEDIYRENKTFIKMNLGEKSNGRQISYTMTLSHGKSRNKTHHFGYAIDNMDMLFTGHIHQPMSEFPAKIVIDSHNEKVTMRGFTHIIVPSFDRFGGYTLRDEYLPHDATKIPIVECSGTQKKVRVIWEQL